MGLRQVARTNHLKSLRTLAILTCVVSMGVSTAFATEGANVRISTFDTETGEGYFAASIQPAVVLIFIVIFVVVVGSYFWKVAGGCWAVPLVLCATGGGG